MTREEYFENMEEQIRCKKAIPMIRKELETHMEDQKDAYMKQGMESEEAECLAVREMGNPTEVGEQMDKIHRPKTDWTLIGMALCISVFGIIMQCIIFPHMDNNVISETYWYRTLFFHLVGIGVMLAMFFFDYRLLEKYIWQIYLGYHLFFLAMYFIWRGSYPGEMARSNGAYMCFVPIFAAFVYRYRGERWKGILKCFGIIAMQFLIYAFMGNYSAAVLFIVILSCVVAVFAAIAKGIFGGNKKMQMIVFLSTIIGVPFIILMDIIFNAGRIRGLEEYQMARIRAIFHVTEYAESYSYLTNLARQQIGGAEMFGGGTLGMLGEVSGAYSDYVLTCIFSYFGFGIAVLLLLVIGLFLLRGLKISLLQKNKLGLLLGVASSTMLVGKSFFYVLANLGLFTATAIDMPFLSYGFWCTVVNYLYLGIILSVYRYSNVFSEYPKCKYRWIRVKEEAR